MNFIQFSQNASSNYWFFLAWAVLLGALHGLEPGHSKGLMAAFIIGTRGTYPQAILLALSATISHTAVVWLLAWPASYGGALWSGQEVGPYLNLASGIVILILSFWMLRRFNRSPHDHPHDHDHAHGHSHDHSHDHPHEETHAPEAEASGLEDAHTLAHAREIAARFSGQHVTLPQVVLFGLGSGLAPCTAAIVILIGCFRLHQIWMGFGLVTAFSIGLGLTLAAVAAVASWGVRFFGNRWNRFEELMRRAPQLSALFTAAVGVYFIIAFFRSHIWAA
jgi:ABC-type nickel/cobalt efflux system permease component RcnA